MSRPRVHNPSGSNGKAERHDVELAAASTPALQLARAREDVVRAVPEIIHAFLDQARQASVTHARFVFDFAGIAARQDAVAEGVEGPSFAELMIERLGLREPGDK